MVPAQSVPRQHSLLRTSLGFCDWSPSTTAMAACQAALHGDPKFAPTPFALVTSGISMSRGAFQESLQPHSGRRYPACMCGAPTHRGPMCSYLKTEPGKMPLDCFETSNSQLSSSIVHMHACKSILITFVGSGVPAERSGHQQSWRWGGGASQDKLEQGILTCTMLGGNMRQVSA